jgi:hypothetical protein
MQICLSSPTYDPAGSVWLTVDQAATKFEECQRRVSRTATLDGGCSIFDNGFSHADRTIPIGFLDMTMAQEDSLRYLFQTYPLLHLAIPHGFLLGAIERMTVSNGKATISFLVKEILS